MFNTDEIRRQYDFFYLNREHVSPYIREILFLLDRIDELEGAARRLKSVSDKACDLDERRNAERALFNLIDQ